MFTEYKKWREYKHINTVTIKLYTISYSANRKTYYTQRKNNRNNSSYMRTKIIVIAYVITWKDAFTIERVML